MFCEIRKLLTFTGSGMKFLFLLLLRSPFDAAWTIVNSIFLQSAFNAIAQNDRQKLTTVCLIFGVASICLFLYNGTVWSVYAPFVTRMEGRLRSKLFIKISTLSYELVEATPMGEWITRLNTDVQMPFSSPLHFPHAVCAIVNISVSAVMLWFIDPNVFGWVLLFILPHIVISQLLIARAMPKFNQKVLETTAKSTGELTALITCNQTAVLYDAQDYLMNRFEQSSLDLRRANMKMRSHTALGGAILPLFGIGGYLVLLIMCGAWIASGSLTFGDFTAAFQYRGGIIAGSMMLINSMISIKASMAGIHRINETMDLGTED